MAPPELQIAPPDDREASLEGVMAPLEVVVAQSADAMEALED